MKHLILLAVRCLGDMKDSELAEILIQLVQIAKNQYRHWSSLMELLLVRGARSIVVARPLFWLFRLHINGNAVASTRFRLALQALLLFAPKAVTNQIESEAAIVDDITQKCAEAKQKCETESIQGLKYRIQTLLN